MELNLSREPLFAHEPLLDTTVEQPLECDVVLPDYCPDAARILKCTLEPAILSTQVQGSRLTVEGQGIISVYYCAQEGGLRRCEYKVPFSRVCELRGEASNPTVLVRPRCDYVNCRSVSPRRLDIRGAVTLAIRVWDTREEQAVSSASGSGVELRQEQLGATRLLGQCTRPFQVSQQLDLAEGKPAIQSLLRCEAVPKAADVKVVAGKVLAKGTLAVTILYRGQDGSCQRMEYALPLSQICDTEGSQEDDRALAVFEVCGLSCEPRGEGSQDTGFLLDASLRLTVFLHRDYPASFACDAYSTLHPCQCQTKALTLPVLRRVVEEEFSYEEAIDLPEGVEAIDDLWCRVLFWNTRLEEGEAVITGRIAVSLFAAAQTDQPGYFEKMVDFEQRFPLPEDCDNPLFDPLVRLSSCSYSLTQGGKLDLSWKLTVAGCLYCLQKRTAVTQLSVDEKRPPERVVKKGLYLYLPQEGELLWEIARRYNTSADRIREENGLEGARAQGRVMLLVPVV